MKRIVLSKPQSFFRVLSNSLVWHVRRAFNIPTKPMVVGVLATNRCNLQCRMCSIWSSPDKSDLTPHDIQLLLDKTTPGCTYFTFGGGEPLLVKDIHTMINMVARRVPFVHMVSNGILLSPERAQELSRAGLTAIAFSLDGGEEFHNLNRCSPKSYQQVISAIHAVKEYAPGMTITINTVLFPEHPEQVRQVAQLADELGVYIKVQPIIQEPYFADKGPSTEAPGPPKPVDWRTLEETIAYLQKCNHVINSTYFLKNIVPFFRGNVHCSIIRPYCQLPHFCLEVLPDRGVSPCLLGTDLSGAIPLDEYVRGSSTFSTMQKTLEACTKCEKSMYICHWEPLASFPITHFIKYQLLGFR